MLDEAHSPIEDPAPAKTTATKLSIRDRENALFEEWMMKHPNRNPFATDGCGDPGVFEQQLCRRIVFVLKERNWGHTVEEQRAHAEAKVDPSVRLTTMREDAGRETFDSWWTLMAQWTEVLLAETKVSVDWPAIERRFDPNAVPDGSPPQSMTQEEKESWIRIKNKESLGKCACVQLK